MEECSLDLIFILKLGIDHLFSARGDRRFFLNSLKLDFFLDKVQAFIFLTIKSL